MKKYIATFLGLSLISIYSFADNLQVSSENKEYKCSENVDYFEASFNMMTISFATTNAKLTCAIHPSEECNSDRYFEKIELNWLSNYIKPYPSQSISLNCANLRHECFKLCFKRSDPVEADNFCNQLCFVAE